ncbi:MAG: glycosyltransferase family A protein [Alphaproteobacteria bacterium]|nr:glycosyltransferase family A protein [Alphaproteobacteria bacterium]
MFSQPAHGQKSSPPEWTSVHTRSSGTGRGKKLCLVADASAATHQLAKNFAADGWVVTLLDLGGTESPPIKGITHVRLAGQYRETQWYIPVQSLCAYHWLCDKDFDLIVFHRGFGAGHYPCRARHLGLAFKDTPIVVWIPEPHTQKMESAAQFPETYADFERDFMERETIAGADAVICAETSALWMEQAGWRWPAHMALQDEKADIPWSQWAENFTPPARIDAPEIFISVCLATHNRPDFLREALRSLETQTYARFEVIVIDDGSTDSGVESVRADYAPTFKKRSWRWEKQENTGPSPARNRAANMADGDYLLFMDDDNIACADELERMALAAQSGADILTCMMGVHDGSAMSSPPLAYLPARNGEVLPLGWMPLGNAIDLAPFVNRMGDTNSLFRREPFLKLGGFQGDRAMIFEDFDLFLRASLAGYRIDVIPEILVLYRRNHSSRSMGPTIFTSHLQSLKPLLAQLPPFMRYALPALRRDWYQRHNHRRESAGFQEIGIKTQYLL